MISVFLEQSIGQSDDRRTAHSVAIREYERSNSIGAADVREATDNAAILTEAIRQAPLSDVTESARNINCTMEDLILNKIKQSEQPKATRKRIDVAEVITAEDYVADLQEKSAVKIKKEKVEKQTESTKKKPCEVVAKTRMIKKTEL